MLKKEDTLELFLSLNNEGGWAEEIIKTHKSLRFQKKEFMKTKASTNHMVEDIILDFDIDVAFDYIRSKLNWCVREIIALNVEMSQSEFNHLMVIRRALRHCYANVTTLEDWVTYDYGLDAGLSQYSKDIGMEKLEENFNWLCKRCGLPYTLNNPNWQPYENYYG